jgi:hypothetical protein
MASSPRPRSIIVTCGLLIWLLSLPAYAYIDPNIPSNPTFLTPLVTFLLIVLGFIIRPARRLFWKVVCRFRKAKISAPSGEEGGKDASGDSHCEEKGGN